MEILLVIIMGMVGAAFGSFVNVVADRLPAERSLLRPPSHCDACQRRLSALDLIPVFSYIFLRGRCRTCGAGIPLRVLLVELGCGLWTAFLFWNRGLSWDFAVISLYSYFYIAILLIDLKHQLILNKMILPGLIAALVISPFFLKTEMLHQNIAAWGPVNALIGAAAGFVLLLIPALVSRGGMGFGDVKMAAFIGMTTGFPEVLVAVLGGIILGGLTAIILLVLKIKKRKEVIPFGPFLSVASIITLVWGTQILEGWLALFAR
ncbi:MAG TPA: prepilin peptidase [Dehalococcoidales bacterium]|nr:prepilin peptidase [Dehalococcoidales bacterium]